METLGSELVDKISKTCNNKFLHLPKSGKPVDNEWTVLSCIVQLNVTSKEFKVVSLGTGSKCVGASKLCPLGYIINDSHAEIMARRGFLLYLYDNMERDDKKSIFVREGEKYRLQEDIEFIFYSSQMPCGDASIMPKSVDSDEFGDLLQSKKRLADDVLCDVATKKEKKDDIHRTGAKCLPNAEQDLKLPGEKYHLVGQVRTKPGRGEQTLSVSCSDKMARWVHLGIQGSLLNMLLVKPIFIKHFIFGAGTPYSEDTLKRALVYRNSTDNTILEVLPKFYQSSVIFRFIKGSDDIKRPAPCSILWVDTSNSLFEVAVLGKKLGATKKKSNSVNGSLCISKYFIYRTFLNILKKDEPLKEFIIGNEDFSKIPYNKMKEKSVLYNNKWDLVKQKVLKDWTVKPDIFNFCINIENEK